MVRRAGFIKSVAIMAVMSATEKFSPARYGVRAQPFVENPNDLSHSWLVRFGPGRDLGNFEMSHGRMRVPEVLSHRQEEIELGAPVPHLDHADLDRRLAEQGRVRLNGFEIAADRHAFRDSGSIVQDSEPARAE